MSTGLPSAIPNLKIETKDVTTAPGVTLSEGQSTVVRSILDLFAGRPSLPKLALWRDDATFTDPLTIATSRDRYAAQWYGLQQAFSEIERLHHEVTDAGTPILMDLKTRYVIKGIGKEQIINSVVAVHLDEQGKVSKLEDRWNGTLPEGSIANVSSIFQVLNLRCWIHWHLAWGFWLWSLTWEMWVWRVDCTSFVDMLLNGTQMAAYVCTQAFRHLNAVTVPKLVSVPKNEEEDAKKGN